MILKRSEILKRWFALTVFFILWFSFKNFAPRISFFMTHPRLGEISIDGDPGDWKKYDLKIVDRDPYVPGESSHIAAISEREDGKKVSFAVFYPDIKKVEPEIFIAMDFKKGGESSIGEKIQTKNPWEILVRIKGKKAVAISSKNKKESEIEIGRSDEHGFLEFSIPKGKLRKAGFKDGGEILVNAVCEKSSAVVDVVPNIKDEVAKGTTLLANAFSTKATASTVKFALVHHGNQAVGTYTQPDGDLLYEEGGRCGYNRIIQGHFDTGIPINLHLSGTVMVGLKWGYDSGDTNPNHLLGGKHFLAKVKEGVDSKLINMMASTFSQNIMPFAYKDQNLFAIEFENEIINHHFGVGSPLVAWVPERTWVNDSDILWHSGDPYTGANANVKDKTMAETFYDAGVRAVILDGNQHHNWFHDPDPSGKNDNAFPHKIMSAGGGVFSGVIAIFNNRDLQDKMCNGNGVSSDLAGTLNWVASLGDGAIGVYGDDLEKAAGYSSTWPGSLPDGYVNNLWSLKNQSWVETVNLETFLSWFSFKFDGAGNPYYSGGDEFPGIEIPYGTYENPVIWLGGGDYYQRWDNHASGSARCKTDPRSYRGMMDDGMSAIWDAEMLTGQDYKTNRLIKVARAAMAAAQYEWMWHDGADDISDWVEKMQAHTKNAAYYAEGAVWAWNPVLYGGTVQSKDVDGDGTNEYILQNGKIMAVFEPDGGRIAAMFARDDGGQGYVIIGNDVAAWWGCGGDWPFFYADWVNADHMGALLWHEAEVNDGYFQDTHTPSSPYGRTIPDTIYDVAIGADSLAFSNGGTQMKKITLSGTNSYFDVEVDINTSSDYTDWPNKKRVILQFNPNYLWIMKEGQAAISDFEFTDSGNSGYGVETTQTGVNVSGWVSVPSGAAIVKSNKLLTRNFEIKGSDGSNPFYFKLGGGIKPGTTQNYGSVSGSVKNSSDSSPVSGAAVVIDGTSFSATTDSSGNYAISNVASGVYAMTASKTGYKNASLSAVSIVADSTASANFYLAAEQIQPQTGNISGTCKNSSTGQVVADVTVEIAGKGISAVSDSSGQFLFSGISTGTYTLKFTKTEFNEFTKEGVSVNSDETTVVNVTLVPGALPKGTISGSVTNISSAAMSGVLVEITTLGVGLLTGPTGFYSVSVPTGNFNVSFSLTGYKTVTKTNVVVTEGASIALNCVLEKAYGTGDINKDGIIDGEDLMLLGYSYETRAGDLRYNIDADLRYNIDADLNSDGKIDEEDLEVLVTNYGKIITP